MPQKVINSSNIDTLIVALIFDLYNRKVVVNSEDTTYNDGSGTGELYVEGIDVKIEDQDGVVLHDYDWDDPLIKPQDGEDEGEIDLSSFSIPFLFQTYKLTVAIKDGDGNIYYTTPVYKKICQPPGMTESGYVPGLFQIDANCVDNILTVKELTLLVYNNLTPESTTKTGTLSYPTGTISAVSFSGTPFTNNEIYTGQYRVNCTTVSRYDLEDEVYVDVTYLTNNVFEVNCSNSLPEIICCITELQVKAIEQCNNAIGKNAQAKLAEIAIPFMSAVAATISGKNAAPSIALIKKHLKCDCGTKGLSQNEFTPINPAVTSIVLSGVGGTTIPAATITGNTKTFQIASNVYQVVKGNTGDLAFTITTDTSTQYVVKYKITFNYTTMAGYILDAIEDSSALTAQLNALIESSGLDLTGLDGKCVLSLASCDYVYANQNIDGDTQIVSITIDDEVYEAPADTYLVGGAIAIQNWLNSLGKGTFSVTVDAGQRTLLIMSDSNPNTVQTIQFNFSGLFNGVFIQSCEGLVNILQAIINYLCELTALQVALGRALDLCAFDYNGEIVTTSYPESAKQDNFNVGVANSICNIVARIDTLTGITCAKMVALFTDSESSTFSSVARAYGNDGTNCVGFTPKQIALGVIAAIQAYTDVKEAFCAIDCESPGTCPEVGDFSLAMAAANIGIYGVTWGSSTTATQTVTVQYKLSSSSTWLTATSSLAVLANGNLSGTTPFTIGGVVQGSTYDVRIINNCGGVGFTKQITVPTGTVYSGSFILDTIIYNICGNTPVTLYSAAPFGEGVVMYTDAGLTTPATGYNWIADNNNGDIYEMDSATGEVLTDTGSSCENGIAGTYILGNDTSTICAGSPETLYTNGVFAVGGTLYNDSALTSPVTGSSYVVNASNNHIYNLNTSTGQIGADTGLACGVYSSTFRIDNSSGTVCAQAPVTLYHTSGSGLQSGITMYTDIALTTPLTGYTYITGGSGATPVFNLNTATGVVGSLTGGFCS